MKKILLILTIALSLSACGEKEIVYLDSKTGEPVEPSKELIAKKNETPDWSEHYDTVCINHVHYYVPKGATPTNSTGRHIVPFPAYYGNTHTSNGNAKSFITKCNIPE